jgi:hypothetical protein
MKNSFKRCKLCMCEKALIKKSHIIPAFMYKDFEDKYLVSIKSIDANKKHLNKKRSPIGEYEGGILCDDCEKLFHENYVSILMYNETFTDKSAKSHLFKTPDGVEFIRFSNVEYSQYKLFLLSLLWKASVSSRPAYKQVQLSFEHEEKIRKMIIENNAGQIYDYPIRFFTYLREVNTPKDYIMVERINGTNYESYLFIICGMLYEFFITTTERDAPPNILTHTIRKTNEFDMFYLPLGTGHQIIYKHLIP